MPKIALFAAALVVCCSLLASAQSNQDAQQPSPSQAAPAQPVHVPGSEMLGLVDNKTMPQYPPEALTKGIQGSVTFNIVVDETGKLLSSQTVQGDPVLVAASKKVLDGYHFHPYVVDGTPVKVASQMGFQYKLSKKGDSTEGEVECISTLP